MKAWILAAEAFTTYGLVLWSHSLRHKYGLAFFYSLIGCLTAIMSWVTDAGVAVKLGETTFLVGSTVFYTSLLLGVFVVYVFDGPRATRVAILTIVGVSALVPLVSVVLHLQMHLSSTTPLSYVPIPSLRINIASVLTTLADLLFLAISWEYLHGRLRSVPLLAKAFLTFLGVMWLDVVLFNTGAFLGQPDYLSIMSGTLLSRLIITAFAAPILWGYLSWQRSIKGVDMPHRPVFAILQELSELRVELQTAQEEIQRRKVAEALLQRSEQRYRQLVLNASEPIAVVKNGLYLLHNAQFLELTGLNETDIQAASFSDFVHPADRDTVDRMLDEAGRENGVPHSLEFRGVTAEGGVIDIQANVVGIDWDGAGAILAFLHDNTARLCVERRLIAEANSDELTRVLNRRGFTERFEALAEHMHRQGRDCCMLYLDVDQFKEINDTHGHLAGDMVLQSVATAIRSHVREGDVIGRMGGDEFAVLLAGADNAEAEAVSRRILQSVAATCETITGIHTLATVSIGIAHAPYGEPLSPLDLLHRADKALLDAKRQGKNQIRSA
ncbi:sensor domain-containing diguanylate cyclase [Fundidesulfovibrio putealis]|uniref:sensor domain-containing diguanylate cyclase n=1 Tax=Fundidesulfovibrio putealis TaxID=270496 RepID=UPI0004299FC8|nr:sensor domain-containing diguanylate cyclase [Fundidesulfovibrio putealis]